jgi:hypothetical protein
MTMNVRTKRAAQNVLYYSTLALLAMPWGGHPQLFGNGLAVRLALILMVAAGFALSGRGSCRVTRG